MKRAILCLWVGLAVYSLVLYAFGPAGFSAFRGLIEERERMERSVTELRRLNENLARQIAQMQGDGEMVGLEARQYGLLAEGERLVLIQPSRVGSRNLEIGKAPRGRQGVRRGENLAPLCGLAAGFMSFALSLAIKKRETRLSPG